MTQEEIENIRKLLTSNDPEVIRMVAGIIYGTAPAGKDLLKSDNPEIIQLGKDLIYFLAITQSRAYETEVKNKGKIIADKLELLYGNKG